jgi:hypothetical protein
MNTLQRPNTTPIDAEKPKGWTDPYGYFNRTTDKNGKVILTENSLSGKIAYGIRAQAGYYRGKGFTYQFKRKIRGRWEPWNPVVEVICMPVLKPVPYIGGKPWGELPQKGVARGFDLFENDWVKPHGKGKHSDILFSFEKKAAHESGDLSYDYRLKITFPNKGDGIQAYHTPEIRSDFDDEFSLPRYAPTVGYQNSLELKFEWNEESYFEKREDQNYFIRVRTVLGKDGKVKSAFYGKIIGNIELKHVDEISFSYKLNPNPLDVNMEFDREKNLLDKSWQKKEK